MRTFILLLTISVLSPISFAISIIPQAVQWSSKSYGPDGPWQSVTVSIGYDPSSQNVDLLPGGSWMSNILSSDICLPNTTCYGMAAGTYNISLSKTEFGLSQTGYVTNTSFSSTVGALPALFGDANWVFDTVSIQCSNGIAGNGYKQVVDNFDMLLITDGYSTLPNGTRYSVQVGKLSLGAPSANQTWRDGSKPNWNGTFLPESMFEAGKVPSNSYGMHVGSASLGIPGSLYIGGYDNTRVLGPVSSQAYGIDHLPIDLLDIGIGIAEGESPFNFSSRSGLLASGNSSIGPAMPVLVEATLPYLYLPQSSCDAIARNLPVTFQPDLGLYFWNTADSLYQNIISSSSFLVFTFRLNSSISQNITIKVPFALLNLTLDKPLVRSQTPYFPCRPGGSPTGGFALGRAFLQAAFIGVNWQSSNGVWFLAQAPGPNTPTENPATAINTGDNYIIGSTNDWADTWKGSWIVSSSTSNTTTSDPQSSTGSGLSKGAVAGIVVGVVIGPIILGAIAFNVARRRNYKRNGENPASSGEGYNPGGQYDMSEMPAHVKGGHHNYVSIELDTVGYTHISEMAG